MAMENASEAPMPAGGPQAATASSFLLEARNLQKSFAGVVALSRGSLQLQHNEIHAVVGDNGAGKSTLLKIISGALQPDGGELLLEGQAVTLSDPSAARRLGISTVFQDLALINHLDAAANMFLGREITRPGWPSWLGVLDKRAMRQTAETEIRRLKIGVRSVDPRLFEAAAMLGCTGPAQFFRVVLPAALPSIFTGMRLGLGFAWVVIVVGEMTGVPTGLGAIIMEARQLSRTEIVISGMIVIGVFGFLSDQLVMLLGKRLLAWSPSHG